MVILSLNWDKIRNLNEKERFSFVLYFKNIIR